jgi:hypothetical protein
MRYVMMAAVVTAFVAAQAFGAEYYVATTGSDSNLGTDASPWLTVKKAAGVAVAGDTIWVHGGLYMNQPKATCSKIGTESAPIRIWAVPGEYPILDFTGETSSGFSITGAWWHLKGFQVQRAYNGGIRINNATAHHNIIENITAYDNKNMGISIGGSSSGPGNGPSDNLILNCDSYLNNDPQNNYENADGFGAKYYIGTGNKFVGCRAWGNCDDGFDCWYTGNAVHFEDCYAWDNGVNIWGGSPFAGDGNGFKLGQMLGEHVVIRCATWDQWHYGFDLNGNSSGVTVEQCTAIRCDRTFAFTFTNGNEDKTVLRNNLSYAGTVAIDPRMVNENNSWNTPGVSITAEDFVSLDTTALEGPRNADGSVPLAWPLRLAQTSEAIDVGMDIGLVYAGVAHDLGAFEAGDTNGGNVVDWLDICQMAQDWLASGLLADIDLSGSVDFTDFAILMWYW